MKHFNLLLCMSAILLNIQTVRAQLSGTYLVDAGGGGQYTTISAAANDLNNQGVNGPVTIIIAPGIYNEQFELHDVSGTNTTNTITIQSSTGNADDVEIRFAATKEADNYIAKIYNLTHLTVQHLTFRAMATQYSTGISLRNGLEHVRFQYLKLRGHTGFGSDGYALENNSFIDSVTLNMNPSVDVYVGYNDFDSCQTGIFYMGNASFGTTGLVVDNNTFGAIRNTCILTSLIDSLIITNNYIDSSYQQGTGINASAFNYMGITNNVLYNVDAGMLVLGSSGFLGLEVFVANNFVVSEDVSFHMTSLDTAEIYHNTLKSMGHYAFISGSGIGLKIYNNIFYTENFWAAANFSNASASARSDNNTFYNAAHDSLIVVDSSFYLKYYSDLAVYATDKGRDSNSIATDPGFLGSYDLHITSLALRDAGKPLGGAVPFDIDGDSRDPLAPDIGADEITAIANLVPTQFSAPTSQGSAGQAFQITYTADNVGTLSLNGPWQDAIYLSPDATLSPGDTLLAEVNNNFTLGGGQSYSPSPSVILPDDSSGNMYLILVLDHHNVLPEDFSDNSATLAIQITIPNRPDLVVDTVYGPANVSSGQQFTLTWVVTNVGSEPTQASWKDFIYVNTDSAYLGSPNFDPDSAHYDSRNNPIGLKPGESYTQQQIVNTPFQYAGPLYYSVYTDRTDQVVEEDNTLSSNITVSGPVYIQQSPLPNLQVTLAQAPSTSFAGEEIIINYEVKNVGNAKTIDDTWRDYVFILQDSVVDPDEPLKDLFDRGERIASFSHIGELQPGAFHTVTDTVKLPDCLAGRHYLFIYADGNRETFELTETDNHTRTDSITILNLPNPDLEGQSVAITSPGPASGEWLDIEFTVANTGFTAPTTHLWYDKIYLSRDDQFDPEEDKSLATYKWENGLDTGKTYTVNNQVHLHDSLFGTFYFLLYTDATDRVCEYPYDGNNVLASAPVNIALSPQADLAVTSVNSVPATITAGTTTRVDATITNQGNGNPSHHKWTDGFYLIRQGLPADSTKLIQRHQHEQGLAPSAFYDHTVYLKVPYLTKPGQYEFRIHTDDQDGVFEPGMEGNNIQSTGSFQVIHDSSSVSDLAVTQINLPGTGYAGELLQVNYQVDNLNNVQTSTSDWFEQAVVFDDQGNRIAYSKSQHLGHVNGMGNYSNTIHVRLPYGKAGNFIVQVKIDTTHRLIEYVRDNHILTEQVNVIDPPRPDLLIDYITNDTAVIAGQKLLLNFQVKNDGPGATMLDTFWTDKVYLSKDFILDKSDIHIASVDHYGSLNQGSTYLEIVHERTPLYLSGDFLLLVKTDANDDVYEAQKEFNNVGIAPNSVTIIPPAAVDLVPTNLVFTNPSPNFYQLDYSIVNQSSNAAIGSFEDKIFLSSDTIWDPDDPIVRTVTHPYDTIAPQAMVNKQVSMFLPPLPPGDYYLFVQVDAFNYLYDVDRSNNRQRTPGSLFIDNIQTILPDTTYLGAFEKGSGRGYYKISVPQQQAMLVTIENEDVFHPDVPTELYGRHGAVPDFTHFDYRHDRPFQSKQEVIVTSLDSLHMDYLLARMSTAAIDTSEELDYSIRADFKDFEIVESAPLSGGNYGTVLLDIKGFDFDDTMDVRLVRPSDTIRAYQQFSPNTTILRAYMDLVDHDTGWYDLQITKTATGAVATLDSAFWVIQGGSALLFSQVTSQARALIGTTMPYYVEFGNRGSINAYDQILCVAAYPVNDDMKDVQINFLGDGLDIPVDSLEALNSPGDEVMYETDSFSIYLMWLPYMPAQSTGQVSFNMRSTKVVNVMVSSFYLQEPFGSFGITGQPNQITTSQQLALMDSLLAQSAAAHNQRRAGCEEEFTFDKGVERVKENVKGIAEYIGINTSLGGWAKGKAEAKLIDYAVQANDKVLILKGAKQAYSEHKKVTDVMENPFFKKDIELLGECLTIEEVANCFQKIRDPNPNNNYYHSGYRYVNTCKKNNGGGGGGSPNSNALTRWLASLDPNDIIGPAGQGAARFITRDQTLLYRVRFENASIATAPARTVAVTNPLAPYFDYKTFKLHQIGFGDTVINLPQSAFVQSEYGLPASYGPYKLAVTAGVDPGNQRAFWEMRTIDPVTSQLTTDPDGGFLPPNDSTGIGQGFLTYTVKLQDTVALGRLIENQAVIRFDQNGPLSTNVWTNVLAGTEPQSQVLDTVQFLDSVRFKVDWDGTDGIPFGAGLKGFEVYVAVNNGTYRIWQPLTNARSAVYTGEVDSTYHFYSVAFDSLGNEEDAPSAPDLSVTVTGMQSVGPKAGLDWSWQVAPNPFSQHLQATITIPEGREVRLEAFDLSGRHLTAFFDGHLAAGTHAIAIPKAALLPKGVILLRLEVGTEVQVLKLVRLE